MNRSRDVRRKAVACAGIAALVALSFLLVVPHSWHKEDGKRSCFACQALRTPAAPAAAAPAMEAPQPEPAPEPVAARITVRPATRLPFDSRAPPFPQAA